MQNFKYQLASVVVQFVSELVENPEDRFCRDGTHVIPIGDSLRTVALIFCTFTVDKRY